jgi:hypothetical protein
MDACNIAAFALSKQNDVALLHFISVRRGVVRLNMVL